MVRPIALITVALATLAAAGVGAVRVARSATPPSIHPTLSSVAEVLSAYAGPVAVKSFDPEVVAALRGLVPDAVPRGIVGETNQDDPAYAALTDSARRRLSDLLHIEETRPDFVSWRVDDLPCAATHLARVLGHLPVMAWTVRTEAQRRLAQAHADQMVFEGFSA